MDLDEAVEDVDEDKKMSDGEVDKKRGRGKGSGILEQVSDKNDGSFLRVAPEL